MNVTKLDPAGAEPMLNSSWPELHNHNWSRLNASNYGVLWTVVYGVLRIVWGSTVRNPEYKDQSSYGECYVELVPGSLICTCTTVGSLRKRRS